MVYQINRQHIIYNILALCTIKLNRHPLPFSILQIKKISCFFPCTGMVTLTQAAVKGNTVSHIHKRNPSVYQHDVSGIITVKKLRAGKLNRNLCPQKPECLFGAVRQGVEPVTTVNMVWINL